MDGSAAGAAGVIDSAHYAELVLGCSLKRAFACVADFVLRLNDVTFVSRVLYELRRLSCAVCIVWIRRFSSFAFCFLLVVRFRFDAFSVRMLEAVASAVRKLVELCDCCQP